MTAAGVIHNQAEVKEAYDPAGFIVPTRLDQWQEITVYPEPPLFLMSPGMRVYRAKDIKKYRGYLSKFEPCEMTEAGEPEAVITVIVNEVSHA